MNTLVENVCDDSSEEDDDEDDDNSSEMVSEIGKSASKETTRDKDTQDSEASGLTPSNKIHKIRRSARSGKKKQRLSKQFTNLKSAWKNLQNPKKNQTKNFWKK